MTSSLNRAAPKALSAILARGALPRQPAPLASVVARQMSSTVKPPQEGEAKTGVMSAVTTAPLENKNPLMDARANFANFAKPKKGTLTDIVEKLVAKMDTHIQSGQEATPFSLRTMLTAHPSSPKNAAYLEAKLWESSLNTASEFVGKKEFDKELISVVSDAAKTYKIDVDVTEDNVATHLELMQSVVKDKLKDDNAQLQGEALTPEEELDMALKYHEDQERSKMFLMRALTVSQTPDSDLNYAELLPKVADIELSFWHLGDQDGNMKNTPDRLEEGYVQIAKVKAESLDKNLDIYFKDHPSQEFKDLKKAVSALAHGENDSNFGALKENVGEKLSAFLGHIKETGSVEQKNDATVFEGIQNGSKGPLIDIRAQSPEIDKDFEQMIADVFPDKSQADVLSLLDNSEELESTVKEVAAHYTSAENRPKALDTMVRLWKHPEASDTFRISNFEKADTVGQLALFSYIGQEIAAQENGTESEFKKFPLVSMLPEDLDAIRDMPETASKVLEKGYHKHFDKIQRFVSASDGRKFLGMTGNFVHVLESLRKTDQIVKDYNEKNPDDAINYSESIGFGGAIMRDPRTYPHGTVQGVMHLATRGLIDKMLPFATKPEASWEKYKDEFAALSDKDREAVIALADKNCARMLSLTDVPELDGDLKPIDAGHDIAGNEVTSLAGPAEILVKSIFPFTTDLNRSSRANKKSGDDGAEKSMEEQAKEALHPTDPNARRAIQDEYIRVMQGLPLNIAQGVTYDDIMESDHSEVMRTGFMRDNAYENLLGVAMTDIDRAYHLVGGEDKAVPSLADTLSKEMPSDQDISDQYYDPAQKDQAVDAYLEKNTKALYGVMKANIFSILGKEAAESMDGYAKEEGATFATVLEKTLRKHRTGDAKYDMLNQRLADHIHDLHGKNGAAHGISEILKTYEPDTLEALDMSEADMNKLKNLAEDVKQPPEFMRRYLSHGFKKK